MIAIAGFSTIVALITSIWVRPLTTIILPLFSPSPGIVVILWILSILLTSPLDEQYNINNSISSSTERNKYKLLIIAVYVVLITIPWVVLISNNLGLTSLLLIVVILLNLKLYSGQISIAIYTAWLFYLLLIVSYSYKE